MSKFRLDDDGIPWLSPEDIEDFAESILEHFCPGSLSRPGFTPLPDIVMFAKNERGLKLEFNRDLGETENGKKILGQFHIPEVTIFIDRSLDMNGPIARFTLAHEFAHFLLHRSVKSTSLSQPETKTLTDTTRELVLNKIPGGSPRKLIEWQANRLAAALLMPKKSVPIAVVAWQKLNGVSRLGHVYVDDQSCNLDAFHAITEHLGQLYLVSKTAMKIRLEHLHLLKDKRKKSFQGGIQPISNFMWSKFELP